MIQACIYPLPSGCVKALQAGGIILGKPCCPVIKEVQDLQMFFSQDSEELPLLIRRRQTAIRNNLS